MLLVVSGAAAARLLSSAAESTTTATSPVATAPIATATPAAAVPHILSDSPSFYRLQLDLHQFFGKDMDADAALSATSGRGSNNRRPRKTKNKP